MLVGECVQGEAGAGRAPLRGASLTSYSPTHLPLSPFPPTTRTLTCAHLVSAPARLRCATRSSLLAAWPCSTRRCGAMRRKKWWSGMRSRTTAAARRRPCGRGHMESGRKQTLVAAQPARL